MHATHEPRKVLNFPQPTRDPRRLQKGTKMALYGTLAAVLLTGALRCAADPSRLEALKDNCASYIASVYDSVSGAYEHSKK